jgi:ABC-type transport system substrate-binding protein
LKFIKTGKDVMKVTLICVVLVSALLGSSLVIRGAAPTPPYFSIEATTCQLNPYFGYYGAYQDLWLAIQPELLKIGIDLTIEQLADLDWWDQVWEAGWNHTGDTPYEPGTGGWDVTMLEWWLMPHAIEPWFASMTLNDQTPATEGFNIHPWLNQRADNYLLAGMHTFDAGEREYYLWKWQEEFMHDPPIAEIYYPRIYEIMGSYVLGYDPTGCWWYNIRNLDINETKFEDVVGPGGVNDNPTRYAQGNDTLLYAVTEGWWTSNPMYMETYTDEGIGCLVYDTLYTWSLNYTDEQWRTLAGVEEPNYWDYSIEPELASGPPIPVNGNLTHMRVPLKENVLWSDGETFNATDVKYTFDMTFTPAAKCSGVGDFSFVIESVEVVPLAEELGGAYDPYTKTFINQSAIDFILKKPHPELMSILANDWGGGSIVPWHALDGAGVGPGQIASQASNDVTQPEQMLPSTGPFRVTQHLVDERVVLERNDLYWGYASPYNYGPHVSKIIYKWYPETGPRLIALQDNFVDLGEYPVASVDAYKAMMTWDNVRVFQYDYPASNGVWFNFNNPYLSNRYVRQAIAHAIPYGTISSILTSWGIETAYPGKTYIQPSHYYTYGGTTVHLFNDVLEPYEYSISKATEYMKMWLYSQPAYAPEGSPEVAKGPVGDADFDGTVDYDDFWVWRKNSGLSPGEWPLIPGRDIDPDFNNDGYVTYPEDFNLWRQSWGNDYPFEGAR